MARSIASYAVQARACGGCHPSRDWQIFAFAQAPNLTPGMIRFVALRERVEAAGVEIEISGFRNLLMARDF